ncbi:MOSC domain-containing protein [Mycobacterium sp. MYCO198283]|uniref:MOSC domain-containing protein n=1 Tax=Mycobacterium sp. MYCO198283 TaxID=2883505 RepID=UPI001E3837AD|nr:MOSC domain-containing protein [Mycobacterium sp. MYCO198283]MCG5433305.1 MOSC domain-containing protein [Mycobacterium sp. MYCO198283]
MAHLLAVNVARVRVNPDAPKRITGIDKQPVAEAVAVRAPGAGSGLVGDEIGNRKLHGGDDQAVYAYAREDLDAWEARLDRPLTSGMFGENFTTVGVDVTGAVIGERWRVGDDGLLLEVTAPRTPCRTFTAFLGIDGWIKTFTKAGVPGAYLRVLTPGRVRAGDRIVVEDRPGHGITVGFAFHARMTEPRRLPELLVAEALSADLKARAKRRLASA